MQRGVLGALVVQGVPVALEVQWAQFAPGYLVGQRGQGVLAFPLRGSQVFQVSQVHLYAQASQEAQLVPQVLEVLVYLVVPGHLSLLVSPPLLVDQVILHHRGHQVDLEHQVLLWGQLAPENPLVLLAHPLLMSLVFLEVLEALAHPSVLDILSVQYHHLLLSALGNQGYQEALLYLAVQEYRCAQWGQ